MRARVQCLLLILGVGCIPFLVSAQGAYDDDDINMYDDYELFSAPEYDNPYDYEDEDGNYIDYQGGPEEYGDYFFDDMEEEYEQQCRLGEDGKPTFNGKISV